MVEKANSRFNRYCAKPTTVPITKDNKEVVNSKFFQISGVWISDPNVEVEAKKPICANKSELADPICSSKRKTKIEILGITVNQVVTMVGTPSYTSGAQLWKGAAATLNKNPTPIIKTPSTTPVSRPAIDNPLVFVIGITTESPTEAKL